MAQNEEGVFGVGSQGVFGAGSVTLVVGWGKVPVVVNQETRSCSWDCSRVWVEGFRERKGSWEVGARWRRRVLVEGSKVRERAWGLRLGV
jgi:hypothetical protein